MQAIDLPGADLRFDAAAIATARATRLFDALQAEIAWQRHRLQLFGRVVEAPRLSCWIGDADAVYTYSRTRFEPRSWTPYRGAARRACGSHRHPPTACRQPYRDSNDAMAGTATTNASSAPSADLR